MKYAEYLVAVATQKDIGEIEACLQVTLICCLIGLRKKVWRLIQTKQKLWFLVPKQMKFASKFKIQSRKMLKITSSWELYLTSSWISLHKWIILLVKLKEQVQQFVRMFM